jgi:hypothetical protein
VVDDDAQGQPDQDWRQDRSAWALRYFPVGGGRRSPRPVRRHTVPHRLAQAKAGSGMTARTSINDKADGIRAPTMWLTYLFHRGMAANRSSIDRIGLRATIRCKQVANETEPRHDFRVGMTSRGDPGSDGRMTRSPSDNANRVLYFLKVPIFSEI